MISDHVDVRWLQDQYAILPQPAVLIFMECDSEGLLQKEGERKKWLKHWAQLYMLTGPVTLVLSLRCVRMGLKALVFSSWCVCWRASGLSGQLELYVPTAPETLVDSSFCMI
ncbi:hypothetical protein F2P79_003172 [Pimephales promelas]|nr:hypothetical protein F2P79_003172 [Pimephales promelas]